jgi:hypothetical protein
MTIKRDAGNEILMFLVDTSVWIDFLKGLKNPQVDALENLLEQGEAYISEVIFAEICIGAKDRKQFQKYRRYFSVLPLYKLPPDWHLQMAGMGFRLRMAGFQPFVADLAIALTALANQASLLTRDRDFEPYRRLFGLKLFPD